MPSQEPIKICSCGGQRLSKKCQHRTPCEIRLEDYGTSYGEGPTPQRGSTSYRNRQQQTYSGQYWSQLMNTPLALEVLSSPQYTIQYSWNFRPGQIVSLPPQMQANFRTSQMMQFMAQMWQPDVMVNGQWVSPPPVTPPSPPSNPSCNESSPTLPPDSKSQST